jgi:hypothetical protein
VETPREESDQRPEEGPPEQVPDDDTGADARDEAERNPGGRGESDSDAGDATGNPANAG